MRREIHMLRNQPYAPYQLRRGFLLAINSIEFGRVYWNGCVDEDAFLFWDKDVWQAARFEDEDDANFCIWAMGLPKCLIIERLECDYAHDEHLWEKPYGENYVGYKLEPWIQKRKNRPLGGGNGANLEDMPV